MRPAHPGLMVLLVLGCGDAGGIASETTHEPSSSSSTAGPTSTGSTADGSTSSTGDPTTTTTTTTEDPPPACTPDGPGGVLKWQRSGAELPGFVTGVATNAAAETIIVGVIDHPDDDSDSYLQLHDATGAPLWSDIYAGTHGLGERPLGVAVDPAGFIHVLVKERVFELQHWNWTSTDDRLVILRYAPDGTHVWRWEREREPIAPDSYYDPTGHLGLADDRILLLEAAYDQPTVLIALDTAGKVVSEASLAVPGNLAVEQRALGPDSSVYLAGNLDDGNGGPSMWLGRFAADGSLAWGEAFGSPKQDQVHALTAGRDGEVYLAHTTSMPGESEFLLRRHDSDGALAWTAVLPITDTYVPSAPGGGLHCDGSPLLAGAIGRPLDQPWDSSTNPWAARHQGDGAPVWTFALALEPPLSHGEATRIAGSPDGDVIVAGAYQDQTIPVPWLARLSGG